MEIVNTTFSEDLLEEILSRLTVKRLLQLRSVCKLWCFLMKNHNFMMKHYQIQYNMHKEQGRLSLFADHPSVYGDDDLPQFYLISKPQLDNTVLCITPNLHRDSSPFLTNKEEFGNGVYSVGGANGVVLLHWADENLGLWNPATREFKVVPPARPNRPDNVIERMGIFIGLGFDTSSNDFKIVRQIEWLVRKEDEDWVTTIINERYSLRKDSWKSVELPWPSLVMFDASFDGYFNGVYYWTVNDIDSSTCSTRHIWFLSFNFSTESFKLLDPPPPACKDGPKPEWCISKYMDFLAVIFTLEVSEKNSCLFEVWVMSQFDDDNIAISSSWQYVLTIGPVSTLDGLWFTGFLPDGDALVTVKGGEGVSIPLGGCETAFYNLSTCSLKRMGVGLCTCLRYVESLF